MITIPVSELEANWRPLTEEEQAQAERKLVNAVVMLDALHPDLEGAIESGGLSVELVTMVACEMVKRAMIRPETYADNITNQTTTQGPFSFQQSFRDTGGNLYLTRLEKRMLGISRRASMTDVTGISREDVDQ